MKIKSFTATKRPFKIAPIKEKKSSFNNIIWYISFLLVFIWFIFLIYAYNSGLVNKNNIPKLDVVENVIKDVESKLLRGIQTQNIVNNNKIEKNKNNIINTNNNINVISKTIEIKTPKIENNNNNNNNINKNVIPGIINKNEESINNKDIDNLSQEYKIVPGVAGTVHIIFSTDCNPFQDWQSLVLFHSARVVGQRGPVTRIASGCDDLKKKELTDLYRKLYPEYHIHFTPDFKKDPKTGKSYDFYNKPYGLEHWLEYADPPVPDHTIIALLDPDMILLRPITTQIKDLDGILYNKKSIKELPLKVKRGIPVAQLYGLSAPWARDDHPKFNRTRICGINSPCLSYDEHFAESHFAVGPPYIVEKYDIWKIARSWTDFVPRVYEKYPYLLAEMYAYSMGAAHEKLPHIQLENYMVSNTDVPDEGWPWIDKLDDPCIPPDENGIYYSGQSLPAIMHYCQFFRAGELGFQKRRVPKNIFTCDSPLLLEPPTNLGFVDYMMRNGKKESLNKLQVKRNAFSLCVLHRSINAAVIDYKKKMCSNEKMNYEKSINVQLIENY